MINPNDIVEALRSAADHDPGESIVDIDLGTPAVMIDGWFDLEMVTYLLNKKLEGSSEK